MAVTSSFDDEAERERWSTIVGNFQFPDLRSLAEGLMRGLREVGLPGLDLVLARQPNPQTSTYPSEIVTCRLSDGSEFDLILKYGPLSGRTDYGHRGGVLREIGVYATVLQQLGLPKPKYCGSFMQNGKVVCLVSEYLKDARRLTSTCDDPRLWLKRAARWIGEFHARAVVPTAATGSTEITPYDTDYYYGWTQRLAEYRANMRGQYPWLPELCARAGELLSRLLRESMVVIHGEYYPQNVLVHGNNVVPIDWESAALAAGEIDLAMLTDGWAERDFDQCAAVYIAARWPDAAPQAFWDRFLAAQLYVQFRWLGDRELSERQPAARFEQMHLLGQRLGLI